MANHVTIERLGGIAGFGGPDAKIRGRGRVDVDALSAADRAAVDALFMEHRDPPPSAPDAFRYRVSRGSGSHAESVEVAESALPAGVANAIKDELL